MTLRHTVLGTVLTSVLSLSAASVLAAGMNMDNGSMQGMQGMQGMDHSAHMNMQMPKTSSYEATGEVKAVSADAVKIHHSAVKALNWGAMTMNFGVKGYKGPKLAAGDKISFTFTMGENGPVLVTAKVLK